MSIVSGFEHRSGRVISASRVVLAVAFLVAVWTDPTQPARDESLAYPVLEAYIVLASAVALIGWWDWAADYRTAAAAHVVDILVFITAVYFTEGYQSSFTSPFFAFFAFLLLSATTRWGWRAGAITAATATSLFALGVLTEPSTADLDWYRFFRRLTYLVVLSFVIAWFGVNQARGAARREGAFSQEGDPERGAVEALISCAIELTGAANAILIWSVDQEPWVELTRATGQVTTTSRVTSQTGDATLLGLPSDEPFLFDMERALSLWSDGQNGCELRYSVLEGLKTGLLGLSGEFGIGAPIRAAYGNGCLVLTGIPGLCRYDLDRALDLSRLGTRLMDRDAIRSISAEAAESRARLAVARDLHDSVVQVLAGISMRLEGLRKLVPPRSDEEHELSELKAIVRDEQSRMRMLITKVRLRGSGEDMVDMAPPLDELCASLARQWKIAVESEPAQPLLAPAWVAHELYQIVREAVGNAVRHGEARRVVVRAGSAPSQLQLSIIDNGRGLTAAPGGEVRPWSIHERVRELKGDVTLFSDDKGVRLMLTVPTEG